MPRRTTPLIVGEYYHVYNRGNDRQAIFYADANRVFFLKRLKELVLPQARILAWCLMQNHYHLLVQLIDAEFSQAMMRFGTSFAKAVNKQRRRTGHLFQGPFQARHVDDEDYLLHLTRYIHLNPVRANQVLLPAEWEWSSYRDCVGLREGTLVDHAWWTRLYPDPSAYQRFVESAAERGLPARLLFDEADDE